MLKLRPLLIKDEHSFREAVQEFSLEDPPWGFAFQYDPTEAFPVYVDRVNSWRQGVEGFVPNSYLVAVDGEKIVGRVSIRYELNDFLKKYGGHVGYGVIPGERRKGYATEILRQSVEICSGLGLAKIMISCDFDNEASRRVIEKNRGKFDRMTELKDLDKQKHIYWIDTNMEPNQSINSLPSRAPC